MKLFVIGKYFGRHDHHVMWDMIGVYNDEKLATAACNGHDDYFIGDLTLNETLPEETADWPKLCYPNRQLSKSVIASMKDVFENIMSDK